MEGKNCRSGSHTCGKRERSLPLGMARVGSREGKGFYKKIRAQAGLSTEINASRSNGWPKANIR